MYMYTTTYPTGFGGGPMTINPTPFAPQGAVGDLLGQVAEPVGGFVGNYLGYPKAGSDIGKAVGSVAHYLPFSATPTYAPQGLFGDILSTVAPVAGGVIGGLAGNQQLGRTIGNTVGDVGALLPFSATPQYAPQGLFGDILSTVAPVAGGVIGGLAGNQQLGATIGNTVGSVGSLLPFSATPQYTQALAPQGVFGDILGSIAPVAGGLIGSVVAPGVGTAAGGAIGGALGQAAKLLPFGASPYVVYR